MFVSALVAAAWLATAGPAPCPTEPRLTIDVFAEHYPPAVRSSYSLGELGDLAAGSGRPGRHAPLGFYAGTFGYTVEVTAEEAGSPGCPPAMHVRVRMFLADRLVEVGTDLHTRQCQPEAVLSHYFAHADQDDRLLSRYAQRALAMFDRMPGSELLGTPGQGDTKEVLAEAARRAMDRLLQPHDEERRQALAAADNDEEVAKLRNACGRDL